MLILVTVAMRAGRDRARRPGSDQRPSPAAGERPGRRPVLKAGLLYVNRGDPAIVIAGVIAAPAGLALIRIATGM